MKKLKYICLFFIIVCFTFNPIQVYASGISNIDAFDTLDGDGKYLGEDYRDNYKLDIEETGIFDTFQNMTNGLANILFDIIKFFTYLMVSVFYFAMDFDVAKLFADQIKGMQEALNNSIFEPLFGLAFCGTGAILIKNLYKRNTVGIFQELGKVIFVLVLSVFIVVESGTVLSAATNITKSISVESLLSLNEDMGIGKDESAITSYAANAAGVLWINLLHEPWKTLEFGDSMPSDKEVNNILDFSYGSDKRKEAIETYMEKGGKAEAAFNKERGGERIAYTIIYLIPFVIKSVIYIVLAVFQIVFQFMAVFYLLLAPLILILCLIPGYGMDTLTSWLNKLLETQINIFVITLLLGFIIKIDMEMYKLPFGWFVIVILQTVIAVMLVLNREKILGSLSNIQRGMQNKNYARNMMRRSGNVYNGTQTAMKRLEGKRKQIPVKRPVTTNIYNKADTEQKREQREPKRPTTTSSQEEQKGILMNTLSKPLSMEQEKKEVKRPVTTPPENTKAAGEKKEPVRPVTTPEANIKAAGEKKEPVQSVTTPGANTKAAGEKKEPVRPVTTPEANTKAAGEKKEPVRPVTTPEANTKAVGEKKEPVRPVTTQQTTAQSTGEKKKPVRPVTTPEANTKAASEKKEPVRPTTTTQATGEKKEPVRSTTTQAAGEVKEQVQSNTTSQARNQVVEENKALERPVTTLQVNKQGNSNVKPLKENQDKIHKRPITTEKSNKKALEPIKVNNPIKTTNKEKKTVKTENTKEISNKKTTVKETTVVRSIKVT